MHEGVEKNCSKAIKIPLKIENILYLPKNEIHF